MIFLNIGLRAALAAVALLALLVGTTAVASAHPATPPPPPPAPTNPTAADGDTTGVVTVSWTAVSDAAFYRIGWVAYDDFQATTAAGREWLEAFAFVDVENRGQTSHTISRLTPGAHYAFIVGSISQRFGTSSWSEWARLTLAAAPAPSGGGGNPNPPGPTTRVPDQPISTSLGTGRYTQISAGKLHTCGVRQDGSIDCWGANGRGQSAPPAGEFLQVSAGGGHSCGVKADSTVVCWGSAAVPSPPASQKFVQVSTGDAHACGVTANPRKVICWGAPGVGRTDDFDNSTVETAQSGDNHNCAVYAQRRYSSVYEGSIYCWGGNDASQRASIRGGNAAVTTGGKHTCWLTRSGTVGCQGDNTSGQNTVPVPAEGAFDQSGYTYTAVTAGGAHTCAIDADGNAAQTRGTVRCWGSDSEGQSSPPAGAFAAITAGGSHTCGLRGNGTVDCWGDNTYRQAPR